MRFKIIIGSAVAVAIVGTAIVVGVILGDGSGSSSVGTSVVLLAAGDIAECDNQGDEATARILAAYPNATIATLGDNAYQEGTLQEFENCYDPSWGQFKDRTRPATGNHDHSTKNAHGAMRITSERPAVRTTSTTTHTTSAAGTWSS